MMLRLFGDFREIVDEIDRIVELLELDGPGDAFFSYSHSGHFFNAAVRSSASRRSDMV